MTASIAQALDTVQRRMRLACEAVGRDPAQVRLLAVSKTFPAEAVREAHAAGQVAFGENYIQEGVDKCQTLADLPLEWHCIGPIQSNKTRLVAEHFDWVHSIDRLRIAERLVAQRPSHRPELQVLLQVNIDGGPTKSGVAPTEALALAEAVAALPGLCLRGLMTIPDPQPDFEAQCAVHRKAHALWAQLQARLGPHFDTLSMGMTDDLEAAIAAGSTLVRVGTAIFGGRARTTAPQ